MNKIMFRKNKKATLGDPLTDFWSYIFFLLLIIIFFVLLTFQNKTREDLINSKVDLDLNNIALNYLRTPIELDDEEMTIGDLIVSFEENQIQKRKEGEKTSKCEIDVQEISKYDPKCKLLIEKSRKMFEKEDDGTTDSMRLENDDKTVYSYIFVHHLSDEEYERIKDEEEFNTNVFAKIRTTSNMDLNFQPSSTTVSNANCVVIRLIPFKDEFKDEQIRFVFCQYIVKKEIK